MLRTRSCVGRRQEPGLEERHGHHGSGGIVGQSAQLDAAARGELQQPAPVPLRDPGQRAERRSGGLPARHPDPDHGAVGRLMRPQHAGQRSAAVAPSRRLTPVIVRLVTAGGDELSARLDPRR